MLLSRLAAGGDPTGVLETQAAQTARTLHAPHTARSLRLSESRRVCLRLSRPRPSLLHVHDVHRVHVHDAMHVHAAHVRDAATRRCGRPHMYTCACACACDMTHVRCVLHVHVHEHVHVHVHVPYNWYRIIIS